MAQYKGTVKGGRSEGSRLGTKSSGMVTTCQGWRVGITCSIEYNSETKEDEIRAYLTHGSRQYGEKVYQLLGVFTTDKEGFVSCIEPAQVQVGRSNTCERRVRVT